MKYVGQKIFYKKDRIRCTTIGLGYSFLKYNSCSMCSDKLEPLLWIYIGNLIISLLPSIILNNN